MLKWLLGIDQLENKVAVLEKELRDLQPYVMRENPHYMKSWWAEKYHRVPISLRQMKEDFELVLKHLGLKLVVKPEQKQAAERIIVQESK